MYVNTFHVNFRGHFFVGGCDVNCTTSLPKCETMPAIVLSVDNIDITEDFNKARRRVVLQRVGIGLCVFGYNGKLLTRNILFHVFIVKHRCLHSLKVTKRWRLIIITHHY